MKKQQSLAGRIFLFSILFSLLFFSCGGNNGSNTTDINSGTPVTITHPGLMNMTDYLVLNGNTVFLKKEIIRSTFDGFIEKVNKNIGDDVKAGDTVLQVKTKETSANDTLKIKIGNKQFGGSVYIKANSDGILSELDYHAGDYVSTGEKIAVVSNPSSLRIKLNVPYEDILKVKIGRECEISLPNSVTLPGIIEKNVPSVDPVTQTQIYYVKLKNYRDVPESLNVIVKIPYKTFTNTTVLPKSSIITNVTEDNFWIMKLVNNDTTAIRVDIKKGIENDSVAQILSPKLYPTDKIILTGAYGLPDTAKVEIVK
jgi:HlyD family secretion protein